MAWDESGLALLRAMNTPEQKRHLGGPESEARLLDRHARYLTYHRPGEVEVLRVAAGGDMVGAVVYWAREQAGTMIYEIGWEILPVFGGRGYGTRPRQPRWPACSRWPCIATSMPTRRRTMPARTASAASLASRS